MISFSKNKNDIEVSFTIKDVSKDIIDISINYNSHSNKDLSKYLGKLLYCINKGLLYKNIIYNINSKLDKNFADSVFEELDNLHALEYNNDPIIKPTQTFFRNAK